MGKQFEDFKPKTDEFESLIRAGKLDEASALLKEIDSELEGFHGHGRILFYLSLFLIDNNQNALAFEILPKVKEFYGNLADNHLAKTRLLPFLEDYIDTLKKASANDKVLQAKAKSILDGIKGNFADLNDQQLAALAFD